MQKPIPGDEQRRELFRSASDDRTIEIERLLSCYEFSEQDLYGSLYYAMTDQRLAAFTLLLEKGAGSHGNKKEVLLRRAVGYHHEFVKPLLVFGANPLEVVPGDLVTEDTSALLHNSKRLREYYRKLRELNDIPEARERFEKEIEAVKQMSRLLQIPSSFSCFNVAARVLQRERGIRRGHEDFLANQLQYCAAAKKHAVVLADALHHGDLQQFRILLKKFENKDTKTREQDSELGIAVRVCFIDGYYEQIGLLAQCGADVDYQFFSFATSFDDAKYVKGIAYCLSNNLIKPDIVKTAYEQVKSSSKSHLHYAISQAEFDKRKLAIQTLLEDAMKVK